MKEKSWDQKGRKFAQRLHILASGEQEKKILYEERIWVD